MHEQRIKLSERLLNFAASIIKFVRSLRKDQINNHLVRQLVRSATSAGANYEEACSAESLADFVHKLQITLKELNETLYWLKLIDKFQVNAGIKSIIQENKELCAIVARSVLTAKNRARTKI
jgi:four helix bundle protein